MFCCKPWKCHFHKATMRSMLLFFPSSSASIVEVLSTSGSINKENIISPHLYKAFAEVYWNRNVFSTWEGSLLGWQRHAWSKSFPSMLPDEMQTQSNQPGPYNYPPLKCQSPFSSSCVWWEIIERHNLLIYANTLSALICSEGICLY